MNMIEADLQRDDGRLVAVAGDQRIVLDDEAVATKPALANYEGKRIVLGIRPEDLEDAALARDVPADRRLKGVVKLREALGSEVMVHFTIAARPAVTEDVRELAADVGEVLPEDVEPETTMVARFGARSRVREGETTEVAVDTRTLHFFDPETSLGIYDGAPTKGADS
jgi:multiple sugar transport system ATP-binding protein